METLVIRCKYCNTPFYAVTAEGVNLTDVLEIAEYAQKGNKVTIVTDDQPVELGLCGCHGMPEEVMASKMQKENQYRLERLREKVDNFLLVDNPYLLHKGLKALYVSALAEIKQDLFELHERSRYI